MVIHANRQTGKMSSVRSAEPFSSSDLAGLKDVDRIGQLSSARGTITIEAT